MPATAALTIDVELDLGLPDPVPRSAPKSQRRRQSKTERSEHLWFQPVLSEAMLAVGEFHVAFSLPLRRCRGRIRRHPVRRLRDGTDLRH